MAGPAWLSLRGFCASAPLDMWEKGVRGWWMPASPSLATSPGPRAANLMNMGYDGSTCDLPAPSCGSSYCHNGGVCIARPSGPRCLCMEGFSGPDCHQPPCSADSCPAANATALSRCPSLAGDAHCDRICSSPETSWDGGDCALGLLDPWKNCLKRDLCQRVFRDGHCQSHCDNEECLYDGFDCIPQKECNPSYMRYCRDRFSDGHCDRGCHSASCGWDGGDCASSVPPTESTLALVVLLPRESVPELLRSLIYRLPGCGGELMPRAVPHFCQICPKSFGLLDGQRDFVILDPAPSESVDLNIGSMDRFGSRQDLHPAKARSVAVGEIQPTKLSTEFAEDHDSFSSPHFDGPLNSKDTQEDLDSVPISDQGHFVV
ncbi:hypothetical protein E2320_014534 [Naja naja]|nr:hypothetical protein E2320_014534 [Naja naja]